MTHYLKGRKQSPEHIAKRTAAVRLAMQRPEVKVKMSGRPCSAKTRAKISAANSGRLIGYKHTSTVNFSKARKLLWQKRKQDSAFMEQWVTKQSKSHKGKFTGDKASNWRGGINQDGRTDNRKFAWRSAVLLRDNYTCQVCDQYGGDLHIDHIKAWADYPELRFEISNGRALCRPCHYWVTFKRKMPNNSRWGISTRKVGVKDLS